VYSRKEEKERTMSNRPRRRKKNKRAPMYLNAERLSEKLEVDQEGNGGIVYSDPTQYKVGDLLKTSLKYGVNSSNKLLKDRLYVHLGTEEEPVRFKFKERVDQDTGRVRYHLSLQLTGLELENSQIIDEMHRAKLRMILGERKKEIMEFEAKGLDPEEQLEGLVSIVPCTRKMEVELQETSKRLYKPLAGKVTLDSGDDIFCQKTKIYQDTSGNYAKADKKTRKKEKMAKPTELFYVNEDDEPEELPESKYAEYVDRRGFGIFNVSYGPLSKHPTHTNRSYEYGCGVKLHNGILTEFIENKSALETLGFGSRWKMKKKKKNRNGSSVVKKEKIFKEGVDANEFIMGKGEQDQEQQGQGQDQDVVVLNGSGGGENGGEKKSPKKRKRNSSDGSNEFERSAKRRKTGT